MVQVDDQALVGKAGGGENAAGLVEQRRLVEVALGEVPDDELPHASLMGDGGGFQGGAVVALVGLDAQAVVVGGLMVEQSTPSTFLMTRRENLVSLQ